MTDYDYACLNMSQQFSDLLKSYDKRVLKTSQERKKNVPLERSDVTSAYVLCKEYK